ncbi:MAG: hypothetical protein ABIH86_06500 [Planctomycetota bacterium]
MKDKLLHRLVAKEIITSRQAEEVAEMQKTIGGNTIAVLTKLRYIEEERLARMLSKLADVPYRTLVELTMSPSVSALLDLDLIEKHHVLPIQKTGDTLLIAITDPDDLDAEEEIRFMTGLNVEFCVATYKNINIAIDHYFRGAPNETLGASEKQTARKDSAVPLQIPSGAAARSSSTMAQALANLLIEKGIITRDELKAAIDSSRPKRADE